MKRNYLIYTLPLLLAVIVQLPAQQTKMPRADEFDDVTPHATNRANDLGFVPDATNRAATNPYDALDATNGVANTKIEETKAKAERGDADAQHELGIRYYNGDGVPQDYAEATKWFEKAVAQRRVDAVQLHTQQNEADNKQFEETKAKAVKGDAQAQCELGIDFAYVKNGVSQDDGEAVRWYHKAAEQGYAQAQGLLGLCYYTGRGVSRDYSQAVVLFQKAAKQGDACGQAMLGGTFLNQ